MAITITDPKLIAALKSAGDFVEFQDDSGEVIARFTQEFPFSPTPEVLSKIRSLITEEYKAAEGQSLGRPIGDVIAQLKSRLCTK